MLNVANQAFSKLGWGFNVRQRLKAFKNVVMEQYCHLLATVEQCLCCVCQSRLLSQLTKGRPSVHSALGTKKKTEELDGSVFADFKKR